MLETHQHLSQVWSPLMTSDLKTERDYSHRKSMEVYK